MVALFFDHVNLIDILGDPRSRVGAIVNLHQPGAIHFGIPLGGGQGRVTQQLLDRAQIAAASQQMCRETVAQSMGCRRIGQP